MDNPERQMLPCNSCKAEMDLISSSLSDTVTCPNCNKVHSITVFPAIYEEKKEGQAAESIMFDNEASCFYHDNKKAVSACEACGRYLCSLCNIDFAGQQLCSKCIESGKKKSHNKKMRKNVVLYDDMALSFSVISIFLYMLIPIAIPAVLFLTIRHWNSPSSVIPRTKIRFIIASVITLLQITGIATFIYFIRTGT